jgi:Leucine-rich repeat (LRR) protein
VKGTWGHSTVHECNWYGVNCSSTLGVADALVLDNVVRGEIPDDLALLTNMTSLELMLSDQMVGTIPSSLGQHLTALTVLGLSENALTGSIPSTLGALTALTALDLSANQLTGPIPTEMGALTAMTVMWLHDNALTGTIPTQLSAMTALVDLQVINTRLNGTMPHCNLNNNSGDNFNQTFAFLTADCNEITCHCCTHCCPSTVWEGIPAIPSDWIFQCV